MPNTPNGAVVAEIRAEIARQQRRRADLADVLQVSPAGVSSRLNGHTPIDVNELVAIAEWLGVDPAEWLRAADLEVAS